MATCTSALAQPTTLSASQALRACHDACDLHDVQLALICIKKLLARAGLSGREEIDATCSEFAALMNLINKELNRRDEIASAAFQLVRDILDQEGRGQ